MKIYNFNWATGEYTGATEADPSPLEPGEFIIPAYATTKAPPEMDEHPDKLALFDREQDEWVLEPKPQHEAVYYDAPVADSFDLLGNQTIGDLFNGNR